MDATKLMAAREKVERGYEAFIQDVKALENLAGEGVEGVQELGQWKSKAEKWRRRYQTVMAFLMLRGVEVAPPTEAERAKIDAQVAGGWEGSLELLYPKPVEVVAPATGIVPSPSPVEVPPVTVAPEGDVPMKPAPQPTELQALYSKPLDRLAGLLKSPGRQVSMQIDVEGVGALWLKFGTEEPRVSWGWGSIENPDVLVSISVEGLNRLLNGRFAQLAKHPDTRMIKGAETFLEVYAFQNEKAIQKGLAG